MTSKQKIARAIELQGFAAEWYRQAALAREAYDGAWSLSPGRQHALDGVIYNGGWGAAISREARRLMGIE